MTSVEVGGSAQQAVRGSVPSVPTLQLSHRSSLTLSSGKSSTPRSLTPRSSLSTEVQIPPSKFDLPNTTPRLPSFARPTSVMLSRASPRLSMSGELVPPSEPQLHSPSSARRPSSALRPQTPRRDVSFQTDLTLLSVRSARSIVLDEQPDAAPARSPSVTAVVLEQRVSKKQRERDYQIQKLAELLTEQIQHLHFCRFLSPAGIDSLCEVLLSRAAQGVGRKREEKKDYQPYPLPLESLSFRFCGLVTPPDRFCSLLVSPFVPALQSLDLHGNPLGAAGVQVLANSVRGLTGLRTLVLSRCNVDMHAIDPLFDLLKACPSVTALSLCENNLWSTGVSELFERIVSVSSLQCLQLKFVGADSACVDDIYESLRANKVPLRELSLKGNFFSDADGKVQSLCCFLVLRCLSELSLS